MDVWAHVAGFDSDNDLADALSRMDEPEPGGKALPEVLASIARPRSVLPALRGLWGSMGWCRAKKKFPLSLSLALSPACTVCPGAVCLRAGEAAGQGSAAWPCTNIIMKRFLVGDKKLLQNGFGTPEGVAPGECSSADTLCFAHRASGPVGVPGSSTDTHCSHTGFPDRSEAVLSRGRPLAAAVAGLGAGARMARPGRWARGGS